MEYAKRPVFEGFCRKGDIRYPDSEKNECEWRPMDGPASQIVVANKDKKTVRAFAYEKNRWKIAEGDYHYSDEVELGNHYGHMSLAAAANSRGFWQRWGQICRLFAH